jgi:TctA family transporter
MKLTSVIAGFATVFAGLVSAQQTVTSGTRSSNIVSQYGDSFKNAGGNILKDKVNGKYSSKLHSLIC